MYIIHIHSRHYNIYDKVVDKTSKIISSSTHDCITSLRARSRASNNHKQEHTRHSVGRAGTIINYHLRQNVAKVVVDCDRHFGRLVFGQNDAGQQNRRSAARCCREQSGTSDRCARHPPGQLLLSDRQSASHLDTGPEAHQSRASGRLGCGSTARRHAECYF